jgi:hypothetical protein
MLLPAFSHKPKESSHALALQRGDLRAAELSWVSHAGMPGVAAAVSLPGGRCWVKDDPCALCGILCPVLAGSPADNLMSAQVTQENLSLCCVLPPGAAAAWIAFSGDGGTTLDDCSCD